MAGSETKRSQITVTLTPEKIEEITQAAKEMGVLRQVLMAEAVDVYLALLARRHRVYTQPGGKLNVRRGGVAKSGRDDLL